MLPNQRWFFEELYGTMVNPGRWTIGAIYRLTPGTTEHITRDAVSHVLAQHESLRVRFRRDDGEWRQWVAPPDAPFAFRVVDLSLVPPASRKTYIGRLAEQLGAAVNIDQGALIQFAYVDLGVSEPPRLIMIAHHLLLDAFSMRIIVKDLALALKSLRDGTPVRLPRGTAFSDCVAMLHRYGEQGLRQELEYWRSMSRQGAVRLPVDADQEPSEAIRLWDTTASEVELPAVSGTGAGEALDTVVLAAVAGAVTTWAGGPVWVRSVHHGRDLVSAGESSERVLPTRSMRTVGWFATAGLHLLPVQGNDDLSCYIRAISGAVNAPPNHGIGLSLLRWLPVDGDVDPAVADIWAKSGFMFNYMSVTRDQSYEGIARSDEPIGGYRDLMEPRLALHVRARAKPGRLSVFWDFDPTRRAGSTIERLSENAKTTLAAHSLDSVS
ncbi:hypothetical protein F4560_000049 [Saccharothrix ecbatanensis]|uniref:Condensation domain-containing protein n=1 Tax=Saccharothrix ecbatanensis TaxID=1105145 RepID=A0A7W9HE37_9PSEU|nr:condensation domain-containing protein [Saccharothrix ecbatanensis]MBB5800281.1 hypothetical protein [Saccharothrix ecbatanensis]